MAKRLLLNVLLNVLGDFIDGLTEENLKLAVWSGEVVLENLSINKRLLRRLNAPFALRHGVIRRLELVVPWGSLESSPVRVLVDGVFVGLEPLNLSELDPEQVRQTFLASKFLKLDEADKTLLPSDSEESATYFQRLSAKIVDNLELRLRNVHVRYEDGATVPGRVFSAGLTLDAFTVATTDAAWNERFVARPPSRDPSSIHKLGTLQNAGVYWDISAEALSQLHAGEWAERMLALVYASGREVQRLEYVLQPPNVLVVQLVHNEHYPEDLPRYDVVLKSTEVSLRVDREQVRQLGGVLDMAARADRLQRIAMERRPQLRPTADARAWWRYACKLVVGRGGRFRLRAEVAWRCMAVRRRYVALVRQLQDQRGLDFELATAITQEEVAELAALEEELPLEALLVFRQCARRERLRESQQRRASVPDKGRTWADWWSGQSAVEQGDVSLLLAEEDSSEGAGLLLRLRVASSATLLLSEGLRPIVAATMGAAVGVELRGEAVSATLRIDELSLEDLFTARPVVRHIVTVQREAEGDQRDGQHVFDVTYEHAPGSTKVIVTALPLDITLNKLCVQRLLAFFVAAPDASPRRSHAAHAKRRTRGASRRAEGGFTFTFETTAPKIMVPEDSCSDKGCLLLDAGHLVVLGHMGARGMVWNVNLKAVNAGLPQSARDLTSFREEDRYLIRPFSVQVTVETVEKSNADMNVDVLVRPSLAGELDALKLARLLHVVRNVTATFAGDEEASSDAPVGEGGDLSRVLLLVRVSVSEVRLDLHYLSAHRLVLAVRTLNVTYCARRLDSTVLVEVLSLSIEDTARAPSHRQLLWTPASSENLVKVSYAFMRSRGSPVYLNHAAEVRVAFANTALEADEDSLLHLRPFVLVLLGRDAYSAAALGAAADRPAPPCGGSDGGSAAPYGMRIVVLLDTVTIGLLRRRDGRVPGGGLELAFELKVANLSAEVELTELIRTDVKMQSMDIFDRRAISLDCHYKKLITIAPPADAAPDDEADWIRVLYAQESATASSCEVAVPHLLSYVSVDAVLDLAATATANAFACLALSTPDADDSLASSRAGLALHREAFLVSTHVRVLHPRLVLLEDPASEDGRGFVALCRVDVRHSRLVAPVDTGFSVQEGLVVLLADLEVSALRSLVDWQPQQIFRPIEVCLELGRLLERGVVITTDVALRVGDAALRVSVMDILLAESVFTRRVLASPSARGAEEEGALEEPGVGAGVLAQVTAFTFSASCGDVEVVVLNDYFARNAPFLRLSVRALEGSVGGVLRQLGGALRVSAGLDFYNADVSEWEPILDPSALRCQVDSNTEELAFSLSSEATVQLTVTGAMLEKSLLAYSLLTRRDACEDGAHQLSAEVHVRNLLGVDVELVDSLFSSLSKVVPGDGATVPLQFERMNATTRETRAPAMLDLHFVGQLEGQRLPLLQLPLKTKRPRMYTLQLAPELQEASGQYSDPVVVDYFQNERFDPLKRVWRQPFLPMDPPHESGAMGRPARIPALAEHADWEWLGDWIVDMGGEEEGEVDCDGWEYGTSFAVLSSASKGAARRSRRPLDSVRRRRFIRTRVCRDQLVQQGGPLNLFWDVEHQQNGDRLVTMRSSMEVVNKLPHAVFVALGYGSGEELELGPVPEDGALAVPLLHSRVTSARVRPADAAHAWSAPFMCAVLPFDYKSRYDLECASEEDPTMFVRVHAAQKARFLRLTLSTYCLVCNLLPCDVRFRCFVDSLHTEAGTLEAGRICKLPYSDMHNGANISVQLGQLSWSDAAVVDPVMVPEARLALYSASGDVAMYIHVECAISTEYKSVSITIYSKAAIVDRSKLDVCVWARNKHGESLVRNTFSSSSPASPAPDKSDLSVELCGLRVESNRRHEVRPVDVGCEAYTDRALKWSCLPSFLRGQLCVLTSFEERVARSKQYMHFSPSAACVVCLLLDLRASVPAWVPADGFQRIPQMHAICRLFVYANDAEEGHYCVYAKSFAAQEKVALRGNFDSAAKPQNMYCAFVVPRSEAVPGMQAVLRVLDFDACMTRARVVESWSGGEAGLGLFCSDEDCVKVGVLRGAAYSDEIKIGDSHPPVGSMEIVDWKTRRAYQLTYRLERMPGEFRRTRVLYTLPRYCVVNCMDEVLELRQYKSRSVTRVQPWSSEGWHKTDVSFDFCIQLKVGSSLWSLCNVDVNEVGTSTIALPPPEGAVGRGRVVLQVEVRTAEPDEQCSVLVVVQRARVDGSALLSVVNESDCAVCVVQSGLDLSLQSLRAFEIVVKPNASEPFGWIDPEAGSLVHVGVGETFVSSSVLAKSAKIDLMKLQDSLRLPDSSGRPGHLGELVLQVEAIDSGRVLRISRSKPPASRDARAVAERDFHFTVVKFALPLVSVSLVVERPRRRELLNVSLQELEGKLSFSGKINTYELMLWDLQIDNYSECAIYPVLLHSAEKEKALSRSGTVLGSLSNASRDRAPLFQVAVVQEAPGVGRSKNGPTCVQYLAVRLLELSVQVDSGSLKLLFEDLLSSLSLGASVASARPHEWIDERNRALLHPEAQCRVNVYRAKVVATASKVFFETLVVHPMKLRLTFVHTSLDRGLGKQSLTLTALNVLSSLAEVEGMKVRLNSFIVSNALESQSSLCKRIVAKATQDLQLQLASIAGSLKVIGSPLGLAHKIGGGVQAFFYEPYLGAVESPADFFIGIGIGTSSLVSGVVSGALSSSVSIVDSATKGISYLSADPDYIRSRVTKKQQRHASRGGVVEGLVDGGENILSGFAAGVTGLFTKPMEAGARGGVAGFLYGLGQGVVGVAVKPVLGVTDGITSIAQGISNQVSNAVAVTKLRNARALERLDSDHSVLVVGPFDVRAADAQEFIKSHANSSGAGKRLYSQLRGHFSSRERTHEDEYVSYIALDQSQAIIVSEMFFIWKKTAFSIYKCPWRSVSHILYVPDMGVKFELYRDAVHGTAFLIPISDRARVADVYAKLAKCAYLMGNPVALIPFDVAARSQSEIDEYVRKYCKGVNLAGELDGYRFGSCNIPLKRTIVESESELLNKAVLRLSAPFTGWAALDQSVWQMVTEWDVTHVGLTAAHCMAVVLINRSDSPIQLASVELVQGVEMVLFSCVEFKINSRILLPQGCAVVFAWGSSPSPMEMGEVQIAIRTDFFSLALSNDQLETHAEVFGNHRVSFLEKSASKWWSKYVVHIC